MEVAGQWRREWAGTAEYGKVTEGGVTRQVARAMEVVHASAPGARLRVMRAAYHTSAARGAPAASFLMHSSHSVISSGFNLLESPTAPSKPLEISSTPLESSPERTTENYKVTEPDDYEISEPSKWKTKSRLNSIKIPSEESSSTDNDLSSIIDLETRHQNLLRKYSYDSENSDISMFKKGSARMSPLLDEPVALSTLKYKSLLNGNNDWNNRRKSYSFENTYSVEPISLTDDTLVMESSTDSGICKSTELINDSDEKLNERKGSPTKKYDSFKSWLSDNRSGSFGNKDSNAGVRRRNTTDESYNNNITLHSPRKVSVTVPMTVAEGYQPKIITDEESRKAKRVDFCKTELHFTPDTGTVNIIASDEKPPPSQDFRRRRIEILPMYEKPVTLLGNTSQRFNMNSLHISDDSSAFNSVPSEERDFNENTAATKSILKNKIPKPKPYLLGENMDFGSSEDLSSKEKTFTYDYPAPLGVSLINKTLSEQRSNFHTNSVATVNSNEAVRTKTFSPIPFGSLKEKKQLFESERFTAKKNDASSFSTKKVKPIPLSPGATRAKTRQLRDSDLTYFGVKNDKTNKDANMKHHMVLHSLEGNSIADNIFQSIKLVRNVSAVSDTESNEAPEYQNMPLGTKFVPVPTPYPRSKFHNELNETTEVIVIKPYIARDKERKTTRKSRKLTHTGGSSSSRSLSAPPNSLIDETPRERQQRSPSPEVIRHSPEYVRHGSPKPTTRLAKQAHCSPERSRLSPGRASGSPDNANRSPEHNRCSPGYTRHSPEHKHRSPERKHRSPERKHRSPERKRQSPEKNRSHSPEQKRRHSPEQKHRHSTENTLRSPVHTRRSPEKISRSSEQINRSPERTNNKVRFMKNRQNVIVEEVEPTYVNYSLGTKHRDGSPIRIYDNKNGTFKNMKGDQTMYESENNTESVIQRIRRFENRNNETVATNDKAVNTETTFDADAIKNISSRKVRTEKLTTPDNTNDKQTKATRGRKLKMEKSPVSRNYNEIRTNSPERRSKAKPELIQDEVKRSTARVDTNGIKHHTKDSTFGKSTRKLSPNSKQLTQPKQSDSLSKTSVNIENNTSGFRTTRKNSPQRKRYVINYDDKNGTVLSVCKVKPDNVTSKTKKPTKENIRKAPKEHTVKNKGTTKNTLLQPADNQWKPREYNYADRKWKREMHMQRSCQLL